MYRASRRFNVQCLNSFSYRMSEQVVEGAARLYPVNSKCFSDRCLYHLTSLNSFTWRINACSSNLYPTNPQKYQPWILSLRHFSRTDMPYSDMKQNGNVSLTKEEVSSTDCDRHSNTQSMNCDYTQLNKVLIFHSDKLQVCGFSEDKIKSAVDDTMEVFFSDTLKHIPGLLERDEFTMMWNLTDIRRYTKKALDNAPNSVIENWQFLIDKIHENASKMSCHCVVHLLPFLSLQHSSGQFHKDMPFQFAKDMLYQRSGELDPITLNKANKYLIEKLPRAKIIVPQLCEIIKQKEVYANRRSEEIEHIVQTLIHLLKVDLLTEDMITESVKFIREVIFGSDAFANSPVALDIISYLDLLPFDVKRSCTNLYSKLHSRFIEIASEISSSREITLLTKNLALNILKLEYLKDPKRNSDDDQNEISSQTLEDSENSGFGRTEEDPISFKTREDSFIEEYFGNYLKRVALSESSTFFEKINALSRFKFVQLNLSEQEVSVLKGHLLQNIEKLDLWSAVIMSESFKSIEPFDQKLAHAVYDSVFEGLQYVSFKGKVKLLDRLGDVMCARTFQTSQHEDTEYRKKYVDACLQLLQSSIDYGNFTSIEDIYDSFLTKMLQCTDTKGVPWETFEDILSGTRIHESRYRILSTLNCNLQYRACKQVVLLNQASRLSKEKLTGKPPWMWKFQSMQGEVTVNSEVTKSLIDFTKSYLELPRHQQISRLNLVLRSVPKHFFHKDLYDTFCSIVSENGDSIDIREISEIMNRFLISAYEVKENEDEFKEALVQKLNLSKSDDEKRSTFSELNVLFMLALMNICPDEIFLRVFTVNEMRMYEKIDRKLNRVRWLNLAAVLDAPHLNIPWLGIKGREFSADPRIGRCLKEISGHDLRAKLDYGIYSEAAFVYSKSKEAILRLNDPRCRQYEDAKKYAVVRTSFFDFFHFQPTWYDKANERFIEKLGFNVLKIDRTDWFYLPTYHKKEYLVKRLRSLKEQQ